MPVLGIISEFNPLHNGHQLFIRTVQNSQNFDATICVMSGNFVQRGEAAICNKWTRARMALHAGADLIIEIPFCLCVRSAFYFARGALQLLNATGVVTHLAFGSENGRLDELQAIAAIVGEEDQEYKQRLRSYLTQGLSYPTARARAVQHIAGNRLRDLDSIIGQPNNILAIEYLRVLAQEKIPIQPLTVPRVGSDYNSLDFSPLASATAIRHSLLTGSGALAESAMPAETLALLRKEMEAGRAPVDSTALERALLARLRLMSRDQLIPIYEVSEGLENRVLKAAIACGSLDELRHSVKSKRYSMTRINRLLLYILLNVETRQILGFDQHGPMYLHILGFSTKGRKILQEIKNKSHLQILSRGSEVKAMAEDSNSPIRQDMLRLDVKATDLYTLLYPQPDQRRGAKDFTTSPSTVLVG